METLAAALDDWWRALRMWRLWTALGHEDLLDRYRRTSLGLGWIVLSFALFVAVKVLVFGQMAAVPAAEFGLFVTIGFGLWTFISAMVLDGCTAFLHARHWILGVSLPYPVFLLQVLVRNLIVFASVICVIGAALAWQLDRLAPAAWTVLPALLCYVLTSTWVAAILAPLCARQRDLNQVVQIVVRLLFFVTPILWMPGISERLEFIASINPITHFIEIIRQPLLYGRVPAESWTWVLVLNLLGLPAGIAAYAATRKRVVFWV